MGLLVDGVWQDQWYDTAVSGGRFERQASKFRNWVTPDGDPGPSGQGGFRAEPGRYHLYVSLACPWAHRTIIFRKLKKLEDAISLSVVSYHMGNEGWTFDESTGSTGDAVNHARRLSETYMLADAKFTGRVTVPVLWDKQRRTIVNNESAEIIRMFESEFDAFAKHPERHYLPGDLRAAIDELNAYVYENVNDGVYRTGFARTQHAYEEAFGRLFDALDELDARLASSRYLMGEEITEADWRLFTTLVRFDPVYVGHFKCNLRRVADYPQLSGYLRDLYQHPGIAATVDMDQIKRHYYRTHPALDPTRIVPVGPALDLAAPHGRDHVGS
jgi:putative glutathione S-transferase